MATDKKSFLFYCDWIETIEILSDEQAGQLIKHIMRYVNDQAPENNDPFVSLAFAPIRAALKRDLEKYESKRKKNSENALKRWGKIPPEKSEMRSHTNNADSDNVSDNDNDNDNVKVIAKKKSIEEREAEFCKLVFSLCPELQKEMKEEFISWWTERGMNDKKMRFEKQTSFDISRRLKTWFKRSTNGKFKKSTQGDNAGSSRQDFN